MIENYFVRGNIMSKKYTESKSSLISRNITVMGRRTSVRLEPEMWSALKNISKREGCTIHDLCSLIGLRKKQQTSLTAAIRVFLMLYYRASSTEEGHTKAGHGDFQNMKRRAGMDKDWSASKLKPSAVTSVSKADFNATSSVGVEELETADFSTESRLSPHLRVLESPKVANAASQ